MAAAQDPQIQQLISQDPQLAQRTHAALMAHVSEHLGMEYRKQMEMTMGQTLPAYKEDEDEMMMAPDMEVKVSQMAAQAAQQLLVQHSQEAQQAKAQQQAQDPLIQLQQQELQIKGQEVQRKTQKDAADVQLRQQQQQIERERISNQKEIDMTRIQADLAKDQVAHAHEQNLEHRKVDVDVAKAAANLVGKGGIQ